MIALDTNILIYAIGEDARSATAGACVKRTAETGGIVPLQVFCEFANVTRRKQILSPPELHRRLANWLPVFRVTPTIPSDVGHAAELADRCGLQYFDALIATIARRAGASILLTEDLQDGMILDGCQIINPFSIANHDRINALLAGRN